MDKDFDFDNIGKRTPYRTGRDFVYAVSPLYEYRHTIYFKYIGCR